MIELILISIAIVFITVFIGLFIYAVFRAEKSLGQIIDRLGDKISRKPQLYLDCLLSYNKPIPELTREELVKCRNFVKEELEPIY